MNWLQSEYCKECDFLSRSAAFSGHTTPEYAQHYAPEDMDFDIYQSIDFPHVFLGGAESDEIAEAEKRAGEKICKRIDVADLETQHLPEADISTHFPERRMWTNDEYEETKIRFNAAADKLADMIVNIDCPIYIHCRVGANRSVSILAAALTKLTGRKLFDVLREIKAQRMIAAPHDAYFMMATEYSYGDTSKWKTQVHNDLNRTPEETEQENDENIAA